MADVHALTNFLEGNRILLIDIETIADQCWCWQRYETDVIKVIRHGHLLTFAYKWLGGRCVVRGQDDYSDYVPKTTNDTGLLKELWDLLNEAEVVIAHNGKAFDTKYIHKRFIVNGMPPPSPYKVIDTKNEIKKVARFGSNSLDQLSQELGLGRKLDHEGWELWEGCYNGDPKSWRKMKAYNKHDVELLEGLYLKLRPWIRTNLAIYSDGIACPHCQSDQVHRRGKQRNTTTEYHRIWCKNCGGWSRTNQNIREVKPLVPV